MLSREGLRIERYQSIDELRSSNQTITRLVAKGVRPFAIHRLIISAFRPVWMYASCSCLLLSTHDAARHDKECPTSAGKTAQSCRAE